jgi:hypothetical protein
MRARWLPVNVIVAEPVTFATTEPTLNPIASIVCVGA